MHISVIPYKLARDDGWRACQPSSPSPLGKAILYWEWRWGPNPHTLCFLCLLCEVLENILPCFLFFPLSLSLKGFFWGVSVRQHPEETASQLCRGEEPSHVLHPKRWHSLTLQSGSCWPRKQTTPRAGVACAATGRAEPLQALPGPGSSIPLPVPWISA